MKKLWCKMVGHRWYVSKWGGTVNIPFGDEWKCFCCNQVRDMKISKSTLIGGENG